jgi:hypothetical protein
MEGAGKSSPPPLTETKLNLLARFFPPMLPALTVPGFPDHGKTEREMSKSWSKFPAMNMTPIFATKH